MRVTPGLRRRHDDEDGAAAVILAICLFAMLGVAALAVDAGQLWWNRRSLVTDTDAAALAAAGYAREQIVATGACDEAGAGTVASAIVAANSTTTVFDPANPAQFDVTCVAGARYGHVTVAATDRTRFAFAGIFGGGGTSDVFARSHAEFGPIVATDHLRPLPLCIEEAVSPPRTAYSAWKAGVTTGAVVVGAGNPGTTYRIPVNQATFETVCNPEGWTTSGDFLWIDFDGGGNATPCPTESGGGAAEIKDRFTDRYPCRVYTHQYVDGHNCRPDQGGVWSTDNCPSQSGNVTSIIHCVEGTGGGCVDQRCPIGTAAADCPHKWTLVVYDQLSAIKPSTGELCTPGGPGANSCQIEFHPTGFVQAVLRTTVAQGNNNELGIEFIADATDQGVIGGPGTDAGDLNITGVRLCGAEDVSNCKG